MIQNIFKPKNILMILLGNAIMALGIVMFILPGGLMTGGTTGLALIAQHFFHIPISAFVFIFNCMMFLLGAFILGKAFALTTLISSFFYPVVLGFFQRLPWLSDFTDDKLLSAILAGIMIGFSIGIVIRAGASTGGMDIPPLILNKKFGLNISVMLYIFDFLILLGQVIFSNKEDVLYGILLVLIYTVVLNKILVIGHAQSQVKIISKHFEEINAAIIGRLDRGSTLLHAETGFLRDEQSVILTVISNRELNKLNQLVMAIDPNAFMIITNVNQVKGKGFTLPKIRQPLSHLKHEQKS